MTSHETSPLPRLAPRPADSHKGDFGRAVLIGGSRGMTGAISLGGMSSLRSGAGLVTVAVPEPCLPVVAAHEPSYMTWALPADEHGCVASGASAALQPLLAHATAVAIGPGLGRGAAAAELVSGLYANLAIPLVVDADALNVLAERGLPAAPGVRILTPHPGEFRRLCPHAPLERAGMEETAVAWARHHGVIVVLKGHHTLITDGQRRAHNPSGNPGMATGGTGDVLTGIIVALLCQGLRPFDAARLAAYVHGRSGDVAAAELGQVALIASDLVRYLPQAFRELETQSSG